MINGIKLNENNISPNQRRIRLMELSNIPLTEDEKRYLKPRTESVSLKEIPKNRKGVVPPNYIPQPDEDELEDMIDLDELLREMGYGDDEDTEDITKLDRSSLKDLIKQEISNYFENEPQDEVDINEIIETLTYTGFYK
jgi:hypothetical protein